MTKNERTQRSPRKLDRKKAVELAEQGLSTADIAQHQKVAPSTIYRFLRQSMPEREALEHFKAGRANVFASLSLKSLELQEKIVETFDDRIISALTPSQKSGLLMTLNVQAGTLFDKERLERGKSTNNISILGKLIMDAESGLGVSPKAKEIPQ